MKTASAADTDSCASAPAPEDRCLAVGAMFCAHVARCGGGELEECLAGHVMSCEDVTGITAAEFTACKEAMAEVTCMSPVPGQCTGIAESKSGRRPQARPQSDKPESESEQPPEPTAPKGPRRQQDI